MEIEIRSNEHFRDQTIASSDGRRLTGHAIVFNSRSVELYDPFIGHFVEIIAPEAVNRLLTTAADIRALVDHDAGKVIGRTRSGTLSVFKDRQGLAIEIMPDPQISYANDIMRAVARGDVSGMSFGFKKIEDTWDRSGDIPVRTILDMNVSEVSIVSFPAYPATNVDMAQRSFREFINRDVNRDLAWLWKWHKLKTA